MTSEISELMAKARRSLDAAKRLSGDGDFDFAVSRAYYAMFYAAEALLLRRNLSFSKHAGVIAAVHREYVVPGELAREHHAAFQRAFNDRSVAEYETVEVTREAADVTLRGAADFLNAAESLLT